MRQSAALALLASAGCGHLDFERSDAGVVPPGQIAVHFAGGGIVLVDNGSGYDRYPTDAQDDAVFTASAPTTFHVVNVPASEVWSVLDVDPGTFVSLKTNLAVEPNGGAMAVTLPTSPGADEYWLRADRCVVPGPSPSPTWTLQFPASCAGTTVHLIALASASLTLKDYIDLGSVPLVDNTAIQPVVGWTPPSTYSVTFSGLPTTADPLFVLSRRLEPARTGSIDLDLVQPPEVSISGGTAAIMRSLPPLVNELHLVIGLAGGPTGSTQMDLAMLTPTIAPGQTSIDASAMLPPLANLTTSTTTVGASWSATSAARADLVWVSMLFMTANGNFITWDWWAPPTMTSATYPSLPADIGLAAEPNVNYYSAGVQLIDVIGIDRRAALGLIDTGFAFGSIAVNPAISGVTRSTIQ
jgi:hypothetical protein